MELFKRENYLARIRGFYDAADIIKVITGVRRCGKSYLLFELYHQYLNTTGVTDDHIIELALDESAMNL